MPSLCRRAVVVVLAVAMTMSMTGSALAAPRFRTKAWETDPDPRVKIHGSGWGHGVGMSQYGAFAQSRAGYNYRRILTYYYPGIRVPEQNMPGKIRVGLHSDIQISDVTAVGGPVPWRTCDDGNCSTRITQPAGKTWRVRLLATGNYRLTNANGTTKWKGGSGRLLIAAFNPKAERSGTAIEAYHPTHGRRTYKWGRMEYRAKSTSQRDMYMVLDIPSVDLYLRGLGEMPSGWGGQGGMAALRAQVVAARTYAVKAHRANQGFSSYCFCSLGATPLHQAYAGYEKETEPGAAYWLKAVADTPKRVMTYGGGLTGSFYSSSHGGRSENIEDSWAYGTTPIPYLRSVADPWSLRAPNGFAAWSEKVSNRAFARFVGSGMSQVRRVRVMSRTKGGTPIRLAVNGRNSSDGVLTVSRKGYSTTNNKGIVGNDLKFSFSYTGTDGGYSQSTLLSQQIRRIGLVPFIDDEGGKYEYPSVYAFRAGIMGPRSASRFAPGGVVSRADVAGYLYRLLQFSPAKRDFFNDDDGMWQEPAINALAKAGVIGGYADKQFNPRKDATRAQTATFFRKALDLRAASRDYFDDDNKSRHEDNINAMRRRGLMFGCEPAKFCPGRTLRRGPMAQLLYTTVEAYRP